VIGESDSYDGRAAARLVRTTAMMGGWQRVSVMGRRERRVE
jgi:hypothetical protein